MLHVYNVEYLFIDTFDVLNLMYVRMKHTDSQMHPE